MFLLQAVLAWIIATPLHAATVSTNALNAWDALGLALWLIGMFFQVLGDSQLARFVAQAGNKGKVLSSGVWRYTRHPNYFGEIILWIGIAVIALPVLAGWQWVTLVSPIFVSFLLLKVSGVPMLENNAESRWGNDPAFRKYKENTPTLIPYFGKPDLG